jgi:membrane-bound serine protease (ClpP class)
MEPMLLWGFGLFAIAALLLALEIFIPSGGVLGGLSLIVAIAGVVAFWRVSTTWGLASLLSVLVLAPAAVAFAFKVWPHTPIGRQMILGDPVEAEQEAVARAERDRAERERRDALLNQEGVAITDLRPGGTVRIGKDRYDALAEGRTIESGEKVRIVGFETGQVKVRAV